ncbi:MAG: hypothetical protein HLUCCA12_08965 [Rhodobacteraceae bacterium HLUCCA12]|nr:MAG: hypothetical protein HLUCCA12_08965 [Rhodobacteraceae bacterium HLUCCA12]
MRLLLKLVLAAGLAALPAAAGAQSLIASYVAYIGPEDLRNSRGQRLGEYWQIIRQDRANYHRFGIRHQQDEWDPYFADAGNRAALEQMVMRGDVDPYSRRMIVQGNVPVFVELFGQGNRITSVRVQVPG